MTTTAPLETTADVIRGRRPVSVRLTWLVVVVVLLAGVAVASVAFGVRSVGWSDILPGVMAGDEDIAQAAVRKRVPRTVLAMIVGGSLGLAGAVMQGVTRNPLADPGIVGVTSGASLFVVIGIAVFGLASPVAFIWVAIVGAGVAATFVFAVGSLGRGGATPLKLTLAGAASSAVFTSLTSAILLPRIDVLTVFRFWQIGGVGGATFAKIDQVLPFLVVGTLICATTVRALDSLALGDDVASGLGVRVAETRLLAAAGAVLLCGAATAVAGPIAFVGLAVPHLCRLLVGVDHRWLLPFSALVGAALLTTADIVGRLLADPGEVDVGIVTALLGGPIFIHIVRRRKVRAL